MKVTINQTDYNIITSWDEVLGADELLACRDFRDELKALSDIPHEIIDGADDLHLFPLFTLISFMEDLDAIEVIPSTNIALRWYEKFEMAKRHINGQGKVYQKLMKVAQTYYPKEKDPKRLIGLGADLCNQISAFMENYKEMSGEKATEQEIDAGIETLSAFGPFATVYELAGKDITKMPQIWKSKTIHVMTSLHYAWRHARYTKALYESQHPRKGD